MKGMIESLPLDSETVDVATSNCVLNLSSRKESALAEVWRVLRVGGEFVFSDVYASRRVPEAAKSSKLALGECLGGALYVGDLIRAMGAVGFVDLRVTTMHHIAITNRRVLDVLDDTQFFSLTLRGFKLPGLTDQWCVGARARGCTGASKHHCGTCHPRAEDYGEVATYKGTLPGHSHAYELDLDHLFVADKATRVDGNTADVLRSSRLAPHFVVSPRGPHRGAFLSTTGAGPALVWPTHLHAKLAAAAALGITHKRVAKAQASACASGSCSV